MRIRFMAIELVQLQSSAIEELSAFLKKHFKLPDARQFDPDILQWKYFDPRPDWDGSRSYVLKSGARWLAHAGVCPMVFERGGEKFGGSCWWTGCRLLQERARKSSGGSTR